MAAGAGASRQAGGKEHIPVVIGKTDWLPEGGSLNCWVNPMLASVKPPTAQGGWVRRALCAASQLLLPAARLAECRPLSGPAAWLPGRPLGSSHP